MIRRRNDTRTAYDARILAVADALFDEFPDAPVLDVVRALSAARADLRGASTEIPDPVRVHEVARRALRDSLLVGV